MDARPLHIMLFAGHSQHQNTNLLQESMTKNKMQRELQFTDVVSILASNRTRCDKRFSVDDPSVLTLQCIATEPNQFTNTFCVTLNYVSLQAHIKIYTLN